MIEKLFDENITSKVKNLIVYGFESLKLSKLNKNKIVSNIDTF